MIKVFKKHFEGPRKLYYCNTCYILCATNKKKIYIYMYINYYTILHIHIIYEHYLIKFY